MQLSFKLDRKKRGLTNIFLCSLIFHVDSDYGPVFISLCRIPFGISYRKGLPMTQLLIYLEIN